MTALRLIRSAACCLVAVAASLMVCAGWGLNRPGLLWSGTVAAILAAACIPRADVAGRDGAE